MRYFLSTSELMYESTCFAAFKELAEARDYFDQLVEDELLNAQDCRRNIYLLDLVGPPFVLQEYDPAKDPTDDLIAKAVVEDRRPGLTFRELTEGEKELIEDALKHYANLSETQVIANALQAMIVDIDAGHDQSTTLTHLKDAASERAGISRSSRNVAAIIRRNRVVIHTLVDFPHQA